MQKTIKYILNQFKEDEKKLNQIVVSLFLKSNSIRVNNNTLIKSLLLKDDESTSFLLENFDSNFGMIEVIQAFELAVPANEKIINGAVYTPKYIKDFIVQRTLSRVEKAHETIVAGDIACGCGAFLYTLAKKLHNETGKPYEEIFKHNLFGLDINSSSIERTKILLSLLAVSSNEDVKTFSFNLFNANALSFDWINKVEAVKKNQGFDLIVGNPPYVRAKNLEAETKRLLSNWAVTKSGNPDLYIPFFEIGQKYLHTNGILGYITVNSFYKSLNARALRKYFKDKSVDLSIIDFGHEKIFGNKSAYTCICFVSNAHSKSISFMKSPSANLNQIKDDDFHVIPYKSVNSHKGWLLNDSKIIANINKIENCGHSLDDLYIIKNGIATLSNNIYIFKPQRESNQFFFFIKNNKEYKVEKSICRDIIKPNILKFEREIGQFKEKLIYPYTNGITPLMLMDETFFVDNYPNAYSYLRDHKDDLMKRDKGNGDYGAWYAFGRTQALNDFGYKLLFPYMAKQPYFVYTDQKDLLIYCGYAIFSNSPNELLVLKKILQSKVFDYYIRHTSKPYSAGFYSYAKNYVKNFGVVNLNEQEKDFILNMNDQLIVDDFLVKKYQLSI